MTPGDAVARLLLVALMSLGFLVCIGAALWLYVGAWALWRQAWADTLSQRVVDRPDLAFGIGFTLALAIGFIAGSLQGHWATLLRLRG